MVTEPKRKVTTNRVFITALVGAAVGLIGLASVIPNGHFQELADMTSSQTQEVIASDNELLKQVDSDTRFIAIEAQLKPHSMRTTIPVTNSAEEFRKKSESKFLHQLFPLLPGYNAYIEAMETADTYSYQAQNTASRVFNYSEFQLTCDMVSDLDAGLNIHASDHDGDYFGGAGETPENFETFLKGCGDTELAYLDELEEEADRLAASQESK